MEKPHYNQYGKRVGRWWTVREVPISRYLQPKKIQKIEVDILADIPKDYPVFEVFDNRDNDPGWDFTVVQHSGLERRVLKLLSACLRQHKENMSAEEYKEIFGESELRKQKERIQGRFKVIKEKDSEGARIGKEISNYISLVLSAATSGFKLDLKQAKKLLDLRAISDPKNSEIEIGGFYRYFRHISSSCVFTGIEGGHSWLCSGDDFNNTFVPTSIYDASFKMMNSGKNYLIFYPYRGL